jgi:hypothetical protein
MAFVPVYEQDVFVSYAHVNDRPYLDTAFGRERPSGWVSTLVRLLKNALAENIGRDDAFSVWFDAESLRGNHRLTREIGQRLERSANFLAVLSPGYSASEWCRDEARLFAGRQDADLSNRVFVVEMAPPHDPGSIPVELRGLRNYRFWYRDRSEQVRTFARPAPHAEELEYFRLIEDLARDLHHQLLAMASEAPVKAAANDAAEMPAVLLAEVSDDLGPRRSETQRFLEQQGFLVFPASPYPRDAAGLSAALNRDLARCRLFVQLLGPFPGEQPPDIPDGRGWAQLEAARRAGVQIMQWRSPETDPSTVEISRHRQLLELENVQASSLETFKRAVVAALVAPPLVPPRSESGERPLVFLNTEQRHREIAAQIRNAFRDRVVWTEPLFDGSSEMVREDLERNLVDCDAMVMIYADNPGWARAQLRAYTRMAPRRERPVRALPLVDVPPREKPELGFFLPEMVVIDGRDGIGPEVFRRLSESLQL